MARKFKQSNKIEIKRNDKGRGGRGVYASKSFNKGELIEKVPCIILPCSECKDILSWYVFCWDSEEICAVALGYGSLYNHSYSANATYKTIEPDTIILRAFRDIKKGEEITINYNGKPDDKDPMEFNVQ